MRIRYVTGLLALLTLLITACQIEIPQEAMQQIQAESETNPTVNENGLTAAQVELLKSLPNNGPAPELQNDVFLNSEPLTLAGLKGQVVIVDFWTYS